MEIRLKKVYRDINNGQITAFINTAFGREEITAVNPCTWEVKTKSMRTYHCTPDTIITIF